MSTEHDTDTEYGPTPAGAQYEHTDIDVSIGYNFAIWLLVAMALSLGIVYGVFWLFEGQNASNNVAVQQFPLAVGQEKEPPAPRLQTQPFKDIYLMRKAEAERLESYGWVDQPAGVTRIPIDRAMELVIERGLPVRPEGAAAAPQVVQDSSAGRTTATR
jgi:hypothetical protein